MSRECPECGRRVGWGWQPHTEEYHQAVRRGLYGALRTVMARESHQRLLDAQRAAQGLVGIRSQSGVYRGLVMWHTITREFWDELHEPGGMTREWLLRHLRGTATDMARWQYGVEVNPATWTQKVYDSPPDYAANMRNFEQGLLDGTVGGKIDHAASQL